MLDTGVLEITYFRTHFVVLRDNKLQQEFFLLPLPFCKRTATAAIRKQNAQNRMYGLPSNENHSDDVR